MYYVPPSISITFPPNKKSIKKLNPIIIKDTLKIDTFNQLLHSLEPIESSSTNNNVYILCKINRKQAQATELTYDKFKFTYKNEVYDKNEKLLTFLERLYTQEVKKR